MKINNYTLKGHFRNVTEIESPFGRGAVLKIIFNPDFSFKHLFIFSFNHLELLGPYDNY